MRGLNHRRTATRGGARAGFSLLEVSFAIVVLVFGVLSALQSHVTTSNLLRAAREQEIALADVEACMEGLLLLPSDSIPSASGLYAPDQPIAAYEGLHLTAERIVASYPDFVGGDVPDPLRIQLTLSWNDWRGRPQRMSLTTMKTR